MCSEISARSKRRTSRKSSSSRDTATIETAVKATKLGAFDFLEKPLLLERTLIVVKNAIEAKRLRNENLEYQAAARALKPRSQERAFRQRRCASRSS